MAENMKVSTAEMAAAIQKYQSARETLENSFNQLEKAKEHLDRCYKGPAYMALCAKWLSIYANARTAEKGIEESVTGLTNTIMSMDDAESGITSRYIKLDDGQQPTAFL